MPRYTNIANLPQPLVSALVYSDYDGDKVSDISVTGLIQTPRIRQLTKRHDDEIVIDVSELIWRMIGNVGHKILERANTDNHFAEERLFMAYQGLKISGKADLLSPDMVLDDYKFTSVYAVKHSKPEWEAQLNLLHLLYAEHGFKAILARIVAVLRDWSKPKSQREPDYAQTGVIVKEIPIWPEEEQRGFLAGRVFVHQEAEGLADDDLPLCTPDERWRRPEKWAVKKKGGKRAISGGVQPSLEDAEAFAAHVKAPLSNLEIEHRPGLDVRCLTYCDVRQFCSYGKQLGQVEISLDT